jgi:hypothetical protein
MDVSEAAEWFATVPLDGWDGTQWASKVAYGDFHSYDRFITERTFGAKKRVFLQPDNKRLDTSTYSVVRTPDGRQYIVLSDNADIEGVSRYQSTLLMVEAAYSADVVEYQTTTLASGQEGDPTLVTLSTTVCDMDRFSVDRSDDFATVAYGLFKILVPAGVTVDTNYELLIDGAYYEVQDVSPELLAQAIRALRRAPA